MWNKSLWAHIGIDFTESDSRQQINKLHNIPGVKLFMRHRCVTLRHFVTVLKSILCHMTFVYGTKLKFS